MTQALSSTSSSSFVNLHPLHPPAPLYAHIHTLRLHQPPNPRSPPGHFPSLSMVLPPLSDNKRSPQHTKPQPAVCLTWWGIHSPSPATIKRNLSLNKKVTPYLLRLTMMKGNEDKGSSCRYQYKYYWKVN